MTTHARFRSRPIGLIILMILAVGSTTATLAAAQASTAAATATTAATTAGLPTPESYFSFRPGADGKLADYEQILAYLKLLDAASPRLEVREFGASPLGKPMVVTFISSEENIRRLDELRAINRRLALDPAIPDAERADLIARGRVFFLATLSMHAEELAACQSFPLYAYELATSQDPAVTRQLDDVVWMVVPAHNPDGLDMVVANYRKYAGTAWDGATLPGVWHRYVGHDNNRDFVTLTQSDNRAISRLYSTDWYPQVMIEKHGMGSAGPRFYCPPTNDPIAENVEAGIWNWIAVFGTNMARDMANDGLRGIVQHWAFDDYWPGSTETAIWKGMVGLLTENATARGASPVYVEPTELNADDKGLAEYKKGVNMPDPWPGGWWRLGDAVDYELSSFRSLLSTASEERANLLRFRNDNCRREVARGRNEAPYYFVLPPDQRDPGEWAQLVALLQQHGIQVCSLPREVSAGSHRFAAGSIVVPMAQPYRPFIKEVLERQRYPLRHFTPGGEIIRPYDITSWSLPLHRGLACEQVETRLPDLEAAWKPIDGAFALPGRVASLPSGAWGVAFSADENEAFHACFLALAAGLPVSRTQAAARIGDTTLPAGSFVIRAASGGGAGRGKGGSAGGSIDKLLAAVGVPPVVLTAEPGVAARPVAMPRIALMETYLHDMDAGWTRWLFDTYDVPFKVVHPGEVQSLDLAKNFDLVIFPDNEKSELLEGRSKVEDSDVVYLPRVPPEFRKGIGPKGMEKVLAFTDQGGIILAWGSACDLFLGVQTIKRGKDETEDFKLPVEDIGQKVEKKGLLVPGAWLRAKVTQNLPLTWGMPENAGFFGRTKPVFKTSLPGLDMDRRVLVSVPEDSVLASGYIENEKLIGNTAAGVWARKGKGQFVLYSFSPQFRGSTQLTFKLLFNAVLLPRL